MAKTKTNAKTKQPQKQTVQDVQDLIQTAAEQEDQSVPTEGGGEDFEKFIAPTGKTKARFVEYVELGLQPQRPFQGKPSKPAEEVALSFELMSPKNSHTVQDADGNEITFNDRIYITIKKSMNVKAKFFKLFNAMTYGRDSIKHMAQMLGEPFVVDVLHNKSSSGKVYVGIIGAGAQPKIEAPFATDLDTGKKTKVDVPPTTSEIRLFLFNNPTRETWDKLFYDGTYTAKDGSTKSKNFIQEKIMSAINFEGSAVQAMLAGEVEDVTEAVEETTELPEDTIDDVGEEEGPVVIQPKPQAKRGPKPKVVAAQTTTVSKASIEKLMQPATPGKAGVVKKSAVSAVKSKPTTVKPAVTSAVATTVSPSNRKSTDEALKELGL